MALFALIFDFTLPAHPNTMQTHKSSQNAKQAPLNAF
jgi:hypothetical protein